MVQAIIAVLLATLVALLGYMLLSRNYFYDFWLFVLCFVIAKCQFSLLKVSSLSSISQNGQTHSNNSSAICVCLAILWDWRLKG